MSTSSESAEQFIRICLEGTEILLKLSGECVKNIATALYVISKDTNASKGKTRLGKMLKSEKELKIFSIRKSDMKIFAKEAKTYGVLYCALVNRKQQNLDGMIDIMVRVDDAPKVNRIIDRFSLNTVDKAILKSEIERDMYSKSKNKLKTEVPLQVEDTQKKIDNQLENFSKKNEEHDISFENKERKSVKKELEDIEKEQKSKKNSLEKNKNKTENLIENKKWKKSRNKKRGSVYGR